ncbi:uncharacterized protein SPAPADRAFT_70535 [Spathaspora passalidarum NRRL Y-27907]|uniref:tRNA-binding domain-containing protein n=1 Tax=Spathaspora passalidarum (strain NRRL Y-27907 / 11-Y1) TaxID=619300 RepID=G3AIF2_SPAPN|nr:uncharacterized protein SPAPADRAFT_70535 [Spathaspora passalidarum NRRL Y-27907]EGW34422.1 hypothetical protein SPAPADRAFT_70535 [Spathaspora passalidarum NRRL Y-27907]
MIRSILTKRAYSVAPNTFHPQYLKLQVGQIQSCKRHEASDKLYISQIAIGENNGEKSTLQVCSGLVPFLPIEQMYNKKVVVVTNMKPRKLRGEASMGMILAAEAEVNEKLQVEVVEPPTGSAIGERLYFGSENHEFQPPKLKDKVWEYIQPRLRTNDQKQIVFIDEDNVHHILRGQDPNESATVPTLTNSLVH